MAPVVKDIVNSFRDAEKAMDLAVGTCMRSLNHAIERAENSNCGAPEKLSTLMVELKRNILEDLEAVKSQLKRSINGCKNEVCLFNRYVLAFVKMNVDPESPGLDLLVGQSIDSAMRSGTKAHSNSQDVSGE